MPRRPVVYDISRLVSRVFDRTPNGIDRVDFALANHFVDPDAGDRSGMMATPFGPRVVKPRAAREALDNIRKHWGEDAAPDTDAHLLEVVAAIDGAPRAAKRISKGRTGQFAEALAWIRRHGLPVGRRPGDFLAKGGVYLNVSQFPVDFDPYFKWTRDRTDIDCVFFLHDVLPIEAPEYFLPPERPRHMRRLQTVARRGRAVVVTSKVVREAVGRQLARLGRRDMPILVAPPPPDPIFLERPDGGSALARHPYFVTCGTIEPRKNHLLLLHVWRDIVARLGPAAPKLVLIGERGWENEHVIDLLERSPGLQSSRHRGLGPADALRQAPVSRGAGGASALVRRRIRAASGRGARGRRAGHRLRHPGVPRGRQGAGADDRPDRRARLAGGRLRLRPDGFARTVEAARNAAGTGRRRNGPPFSPRSRTSSPTSRLEIRRSAGGLCPRGPACAR